MNRQLLLRDQLGGVLHPVFSLDVSRALCEAGFVCKLVDNRLAWLVGDKADRLAPCRFYRLHCKTILLRGDSFDEFGVGP